METSGSLGFTPQRKTTMPSFGIAYPKDDITKDLEKNQTIKRAFNVLNEIKDSSIKYMC